MMVSFVLSFFPRDVLDEILNLIESVSEDFPSYSFMTGQRMRTSIERSTAQKQTATGRKDFYITSFSGQPVESVRYLRAVLNLNLVIQISYH